MLPTPYEQPQQYGRTYLNSGQLPSAPFTDSPGPADFQQLGGEPRPFDESSSAADWSGSATRRNSLGGVGDGEDGAGEGEHRAGMPIKKASTLNRSAMACTLCRKQKMKCEGKDRAPCRRCRQAGVECTFEAALPAPVGSRKGAAASKEWIESRMSGVETRLKKLETRQSSTSSTSSPTEPASPIVAPSISTEALEARIAQLEAQVYALTLAHSSSATAAPPTPQSGAFPTPQQPPPRIPHLYHASSFPTPIPYGSTSQAPYTGLTHPHQHTSAVFADFSYPTPDLGFNSPPPLRDNFYAQFGAQQPAPGYQSHSVDQNHPRWGPAGDGSTTGGGGS